MELKKFIFDLRFKKNFVWLDNKGKILATLDSSHLFERMGYSEKDLGGLSRTKKDRQLNITIENGRISGAVEMDDIKSELTIIEKLLKVAKDVCEIILLNPANIIRFGVRFRYLTQVPFNQVNDFFISMISPELKSILGEEFVDSAIVPVVKIGDCKVNFKLGPLSKNEYPRFFDRSSSIPYDGGCLVDADYFSESFSSLRMDKFADEALQYLASPVEKLKRKLIKYAQDGK